MAGVELSVVIPAYNARRTIDATIGSVLAQTRRDFELIVVDDGSSDDTPERVAAHAERDRRVRLIQQANAGTAGARNTGSAEATGRLISMLDNDDLWMPNYLERAVAALDGAPEAGFAYGDAWLLNESVGRIGRRTSFQHYAPLPDRAPAEELLLRLIEENFVLSPVTIRAAVLRETGGFSEEIQGADDWDLWLRIAAAGHTAVQAEGQVIVQRDRSDSQSKDLTMMFRNMVQVLERVGVAYEAPHAAHEAARARLAELRARLAREERGGPGAAARAVRLRIIAMGNRARPDRAWLEEPPPEVAAAFPDLARDYGRPASSAS